MRLIRWVGCIGGGLIGRLIGLLIGLVVGLLMVIGGRFISQLDSIRLFLNIYRRVRILEGNKIYLKLLPVYFS